MYDRYAIFVSVDELNQSMGVEVGRNYQPTYNAAPTQILPVITNKNPKECSFFQWGLMSKWSNSKSSMSAKSINLSAETAFHKAIYKRQIQSHRCIVPINGFYAWKKVSKKLRVPYYFSSTDTPILGIAGVWEEFEDIDGMLSFSFMIMTVPSPDVLIEFESQMPAIFSPNDCHHWLKDDDLIEHQKLVLSMTQNHPSLNSHSVSPAISNVKIDYPELINAIPASDQLGNYTLFT